MNFQSPVTPVTGLFAFLSDFSRSLPLAVDSFAQVLSGTQSSLVGTALCSPSRGYRNVTAQSVSVLIVEDRIVMQKILCRLLAQLGFKRIDTALNGQLALNLVSSKHYDLILSDWNMDEMNGLELLKAVRQNKKSADTPFVLITAEAKSANIQAAELAGANGYLIKPFKLIQLQKTIEQILGPIDLPDESYAPTA
ncbi:two-component system, chemotaxis family, response regulator CheY [Filomicrobium insigne]|uniref:Two-component system, chemotaxis family, response regulator CheY n=1 Tax=Filomicrobium insigne TaxID=418854 RepID=A0A1H0QUN2_9HYPH|nr:two-component system, chemotaxis family, response regulator CheY [Filomicrobium insigne]